MTGVLRAVSGPLRGAIFWLGQEEVTVGRQPSNHLCIGDVSVSRQHCIIAPEDDRYKIRDLNSHNGTLVNGIRINECFLNNGDQLGIGDTVFEFLEDGLSPLESPFSISDRETVASLRVERPCDRTGEPQDGPSGFREGRSKQPLSELSIVSKIGKLLNSERDGEARELQILKTIQDFASAERAAVFVFSRGEWVVFACSDEGGVSDGSFASQEIVNQVFKLRTFIIATLANNGSSILAIPLIIRSSVGGVVYIERSAETSPFTNSDLELVVALSNYLAVALDYSQKLNQLETENRLMRDEVSLRHEMVGQSARMREVYKRIGRIAPTDATVLIRGETGTGKELAARAIHENSPRARAIFEAINCALLKGDLLESELFGHEKGAFTGAVKQKQGKLEVANGGTLFLDEVAELPEGPQAMLLRVLQEHTFERLGGTNKLKVDIRIVAATNKDLDESVQRQAFRRDLYYRLNVVSVSMPSLRERRDDIPLLARHFLRRTGEKNKRILNDVSKDAMAYLQAYDWPGNVRELENAIEHAVVFGSTEQVMPEDLPEAILERTPQSAVPAINYQDAIRKAKKQIVLEALQQAKGDRSKAAKLLHIHPNNLYRLMRDLEVKPCWPA